MNRNDKRHPIFILLLVSFTGLAWSCDKEPEIPTVKEFELPYLEQPVRYPGIPLLTNDMAKYRSSDMNSEYVTRSSLAVSTTMKTLRNGFNSVLAIDYEGSWGTADYLEFAISVYEKLPSPEPVPNDLTQQVVGVSFRAVSPGNPVDITLEVLDMDKSRMASGMFSISGDSLRTYTLDFEPGSIKQLQFRLVAGDQDADPTDTGTGLSDSGRLILDDIYLLSNEFDLFQPPLDDTEFLSWLQRASLRYFLWNYRSVGEDLGTVLESAGNASKVSLSGLGYAIANLIIAELEGVISSEESEQMVTAILKWLQVQDWFNGTHGWHGFPNHYFDVEGSYYASDVSTIDWAMCAAGIRVARSHFSQNTELVAIASELLARPKWEEAIGSDGRIAMGFNESDGAMNPYRWGLAFSEETELVYLEAIASGKVGQEILDEVVREKKEGFYPSWFGCGFTYNWLQLWTGSMEPYASNSEAAYTVDAQTSAGKFGSDIMGLTACATLRDVTENGFVNWNRYISNQGGSVSGASSTEVIQISPAPYGAALALPFIPNVALKALRDFVEMGFVHPLLGLPDNIRINNLPEGISPVPNWDPFDINTGPISMAIEQSGLNRIGSLYQGDSAIGASLPKLIESFTNN